jgi:hypothetical protein
VKLLPARLKSLKAGSAAGASSALDLLKRQRSDTHSYSLIFAPPGDQTHPRGVCGSGSMWSRNSPSALARAPLELVLDLGLELAVDGVDGQ